MHEKGKIACLLANEFEDSEFQIPCDWLSAAGYPVEIIGARAGEMLTGEKGRETVIVDLSIDEADVDSYEGLLIPGGHSPDYLRADDRFVEFVRAFDATGRMWVANQAWRLVSFRNWESCDSTSARTSAMTCSALFAFPVKSRAKR